MTTPASAGSSLGVILGVLPPVLRGELLNAFNEIVRNYRERRWEPSELNGGKLCEVVYSILKGHTDGALPASASKPRNIVDACRELERADQARFSRSVRIQIPRMILALYEIRNNRGVGHVGGDVDPNIMDASAVLAMSKWLLAELVRLFHSVSPAVAAAAVEGIVERTIPLVWEIEATRRVLSTSMSMRDKTLVLLYHSQAWVSEKELFEWVEHSNATVFRRDILGKAHRDKLLEFDRAASRVILTPLGIELVEDSILPPTTTT